MNSFQWDAANKICNYPHGATFGDGGATNYVKMTATGNIIFVGTAGLVLGSCYGNNIGWTQVATQNTWYNVSDADMTDGLLNGITHDGSGKLTVTEPGWYEIIAHASMECDAQNKHIEVGIEISGSGTADVKGRNHIHLPNVAAIANTEWVAIAGSYFDLADNATVEFAIQTTDTGTPTITVDHLNIFMHQIAGT